MPRHILTAFAATAVAMAFAGAALAESIPLKSEGGTFVVPVVINGQITLNFTLDSGAADVSIPADVFSTLVRTGTILKSDYLDTRVYELADGTKTRSQRFHIRSLKVGGLELRNVTASVSPPAGSLLLGQSFLSRLSSWAIDNRRHVLVINESAMPTVDPPSSENREAQLAREAQAEMDRVNSELAKSATFNKQDSVRQCIKNAGVVHTANEAATIRDRCVVNADRAEALSSKPVK